MIPYVILAIEDESDRAFMAELYLNVSVKTVGGLSG